MASRRCSRRRSWASSWVTWSFLLLICVVLLFVGIWLEGAAAIILLAPTLAETAIAVGISEFQFGIVFTLVVNMGLITPPIGIVLFVASSVAEMPVRKIWPFYVVNGVFILLLITIPELTMYLPRTFGYV